MSTMSRLSLNQATIKHADLETALTVTREAGIESIGLWREPVAEVGLEVACRMLADSGLRFSSLCRGGFFTVEKEPSRRDALDEVRRAIDETAALSAAGADGSAPVLVIVAGGLPEGSRDLAGARARVSEAIAAVAPHARASGVQLAIEALHPMYVSDRAVVSTLGQALDLAEAFDPDVVGVVIDSFHVFWDPQLLQQIRRAGRGRRIASYQVCDWATPLPADALLARHYPGDGVIDFGSMTREVEQAGYRGDIEVELFNADIWATPFAEVARRTRESFADAVTPYMLSTTAK